MLVLVLLALAIPAVSLAGGSAGDQQYTDPFSGGSGGGGAQTATTTTSPAPATTTASPAAPQTTSSPAASTDPASSVTSTTAAAPTATIAATPTGTNTPQSTLPYTGYDAWTAVGFGVTLVAGGLALRWRPGTRRG